ncbi:unnamed protein product [Ranitomeya imitator]|uniref:Uncharacterized protein n=1 Tax=Ranitomeya imitator TaxID=111125 RepID=A0ABN9MIJ4_9NEOB|nr:unnamed protein product [Ranitomeya imitator]
MSPNLRSLVPTTVSLCHAEKVKRMDSTNLVPTAKHGGGATGSVPQDWRIANVVPIFKKGSKSEPGNYRPICENETRVCLWICPVKHLIIASPSRLFIMTATAAVSPSEYLQPAVSTAQDTQPSPLALLAATCSKIGPPAVETAVTTPVPQRPSRKRLIPIKPAPLPVSPGKTSIGLLNAKGNVIQIPQLGTGNGQLFFTVQNPGAKAGRYQALQTSPQAVSQTLGTQFQIINPNDGGTTLQLTPHSSSTKHVPIKPAPPQKNSNVMKLTGTAGNNLTLSLPLNNLSDSSSDICSQLVPSRQSKKPRKKPPPPGPTPGSPTQEQVETVLIETTADNILQAGNNLLIVQSPNAGQHAVLQLVQPKAETQLVQIPQQALRVHSVPFNLFPTFDAT